MHIYDSGCCWLVVREVAMARTQTEKEDGMRKKVKIEGGDTF